MDEPLTAAEVLAIVPHRPPFRFIDEILEIDDAHIVAAYRFRADAEFYRGHFPGRPITPGALLVETMAQAGVVAHGIYLLGRAGIADVLTLFTEAAVEFLGIVEPGARVLVHGRRQIFRRGLLRSDVTMTVESGRIVCQGSLAGMRVSR